MEISQDAYRPQQVVAPVGHWVAGRALDEGAGSLDVHRPSDGARHGSVQEAGDAVVHAAVESATSALHREVEHHDVYLLYFPNQEMAYASIRYDQW